MRPVAYCPNHYATARPTSIHTPAKVPTAALTYVFDFPTHNAAGWKHDFEL